MNSIWSQIKRAVFVVHYSSLDDVKEIQKAIKEVGLNINDCEIIAIVKSKEEKALLSEINYVTYFHEKELTFFGKLKNENMDKILKRSFDALFFYGDFSKKIAKIISTVNPSLIVGLNSEMYNCSVYINTSETSPTHLINFAKQTLEKTI
jgi:sulfatase maturation enzyme AslB (radical SAM superfamily)